MSNRRKRKPDNPLRDRVVELRRVPASDLTAHPSNWRRHPEGQRSALRAAIEDIGFVGAVIARELADGTLQVLDGHLRAELEVGHEVPVLIVDLDEQEAAKMLSTFDPLGDLALPDPEALQQLMSEVDIGDYADLRKLHADLAAAMAKLSDELEQQPEAFEHEVPGLELMPHEHYDYLVVLARTTRDWNSLLDKLGIKPEPRRRGKLGIGRGIRAEQLLAILEDRAP